MLASLQVSNLGRRAYSLPRQYMILRLTWYWRMDSYNSTVLWYPWHWRHSHYSRQQSKRAQPWRDLCLQYKILRQFRLAWALVRPLCAQQSPFSAPLFWSQMSVASFACLLQSAYLWVPYRSAKAYHQAPALAILCSAASWYPPQDALKALPVLCVSLKSDPRNVW